MSTSVTMWLGICFLVLALAATILQAWLWSFPMVPDPGGPDPNGKSSAPKTWVNVHRLMGLAFVIIYVMMMWEMIPRLWEYQFELPARTIIHACMGIMIGVLLVSKIAIIRWFQHFGASLPIFGLGILTCTVILSVLSIPFALRAHGISGQVYAKENLERVSRIMAGVEMDLTSTDTLANIVSPSGLHEGREVLLHKCAVCHDMRTILMKPRSAKSWYSVVDRMAEKPNLGPPLSLADIPRVTAYLVAISPDLQNSLQLKRKQARERAEREKRLDAAMKNTVAASEEQRTAGAHAPSPLDKTKAKPVFEEQCSQCHELSDVDGHGGDSLTGWTKIVRQMIEEEGAELTEEQATMIIHYLAAVSPKTG